MTTTPRFSRRALVGGAAASVGMVGLGAAGGTAAQAHQASTAGWVEEAIRPFYGAHPSPDPAPHPSTIILYSGVLSGPPADARLK